MAQSKEEEQRLHQLELSRLEEGRTPQSAMDFEAMLQGSPDSSAVWIQFISFHLEVQLYNARMNQYCLHSFSPFSSKFFNHLPLLIYSTHYD